MFPQLVNGTFSTQLLNPKASKPVLNPIFSPPPPQYWICQHIFVQKKAKTTFY